MKIKDADYINVYLKGNWTRLLNVGRMAVHPVNNRLSVAEHSWMTAVMIAMFFDELQKEHNQNDSSTIQAIRHMRSVALEKAIVHDMEEAIIGDIPRMSSTYEQAKLLKGRAGEVLDNELFGGQGYSFSDTRKYAKDGMSGIVIQYFDVYALLTECLREHSLGNENVEAVIQHGLYLLKTQIDAIAVDYNPSYRSGLNQAVVRKLRLHCKITLEWMQGLGFMPVGY